MLNYDNDDDDGDHDDEEDDNDDDESINLKHRKAKHIHTIDNKGINVCHTVSNDRHNKNKLQIWSLKCLSITLNGSV